MESKYHFEKLTPISDAGIGIYENALDFAFLNDEVTNIGILGPYSSGKSTVIETYKKAREDKYKFLHISLAYFRPELKEGAVDNLKIENIIEGKIINQLIHKIDNKRIPFTKFKVKEDNLEFKQKATVFFLALMGILGFIMYFAQDLSIYEDKQLPAVLDYIFPLVVSIGPSVIIGILAMYVMGTLLYTFVGKFLNQEIAIGINIFGNKIEVFEEQDDSHFDKYLNEVIYLFDKSGADAIVFEDLDRFNINQIFGKLREVNDLVNSRRKTRNTEAKPLRFIYLLRDDVFLSKDRTKFFDFIIPIVPVVDSSNSYDQFIEHFKKARIHEIFDEIFLERVSYYIDDIRVIKNINNEFMIYHSRISTTGQCPNKLLAIIIYKNIFPKDFSDLQLRKGFVFTLFDRKEEVLKVVKDLDENDIYLQGLSLAELLKEVGEVEVFRRDYKNELGEKLDFTGVLKSEYFDLIKFLLRNAHIDETYPGYMTYFYEHNLTRADMTFIRSILDRNVKGYDFKINRPEKIMSKLYVEDFSKEEILNFMLLDYMVGEGYEGSKKKLKELLEFIHDGPELEFIDSYIDHGRKFSNFIMYLNMDWPDMLDKFIADKDIVYEKKKKYVLESLKRNNKETLEVMDSEKSLTEFMNARPDFLNTDDISPSSLVKAMKTLNIKFESVDYNSSNKDLFGAIYKNSLYEINFEMIASILKNIHGYRNDKGIKQKNYTLILEKEGQPIASYIQENMNNYVSVILENCEEGIHDSKATVLTLLNDESLDDTLKEKYINYLHTPVKNLTDVENVKLAKKLFENKLVEYSDENAIRYFTYNGNQVNEILVDFMSEGRNFAFDFESNVKIYGEGLDWQFVSELGKNKNIDLITFEQVVKSLKTEFNQFVIEGITDESMDILLIHNKIIMNQENLEFIRDNYSGKTNKFILSDIEGYIKLGKDYNLFRDSEILALLSEDIDDKYKTELVKHHRAAITIFNENYSDDVKAAILDQKANLDDFPRIFKEYEKLNGKLKGAVNHAVVRFADEIINREYKAPVSLCKEIFAGKELTQGQKMNLFILILDWISLGEARDCVDILGLDEFKEIFIGNRPPISKTEVNKSILEKFKDRRWITRYKDKANSPGMYEPVTRPSVMKKLNKEDEKNSKK